MAVGYVAAGTGDCGFHKSGSDKMVSGKVGRIAEYGRRLVLKQTLAREFQQM